MRVVGAIVAGSAVPVLVIGAAGAIGTGAAILIAATAVVLGLVIVVADAL